MQGSHSLHAVHASTPQHAQHIADGGGGCMSSRPGTRHDMHAAHVHSTRAWDLRRPTHAPSFFRIAVTPCMIMQLIAAEARTCLACFPAQIFAPAGTRSDPPAAVHAPAAAPARRLTPARAGPGAAHMNTARPRARSGGCGGRTGRWPGSWGSPAGGLAPPCAAPTCSLHARWLVGKEVSSGVWVSMGYAAER